MLIVRIVGLNEKIVPAVMAALRAEPAFLGSEQVARADQGTTTRRVLRREKMTL
jgi:hypothetical protein